MKLNELPRVLIDPIDEDIVNLQESCVSELVPESLSYVSITVDFGNNNR